MDIRGLHHNAYRCSDSEATRKFYEDFLGLPLVNAFEIPVTKTGRKTRVLHHFYQMKDGSCLGFFEAPDMPFDFKEQHDFDLHIALEVPPADIPGWMEKGRALGMEVRGVSNHGMIDSIYFRDPDGYVIELAAKRPEHDARMDPETNHARAVLANWQATKGD
ncbi:MAG: VOC family protein [Hyphomonadaceae bacterium]|jgi:catechol 2,3-dioxygenase-like lactoylglutathione lyase family enzyme